MNGKDCGYKHARPKRATLQPGSLIPAGITDAGYSITAGCQLAQCEEK